MKKLTLTLLILCTTFFAGNSVRAGDSRMFKGQVQTEHVETGMPKALQKIGIDQKLNSQVTLSLPVRDEEGRTVTLGSFFGKRPVILVMAYYECPMLCTQVMNGVFGSLKGVPGFVAGQDYEVVSVSINPHDSPELAKKKRDSYIKGYHDQDEAAGFHFLTADQSTIDQLSKEVGFRFVYDTASQQYAHASGIMILTPEGKLSRYFYGIEYAPRDMKFGLMDASKNKIGNVVEQLLLYCYHYDPATGKYGAVITNMLRLGGGLTLACLGLLFYFFHRRNKLKAQIQLGNIA